MEGDGGRGLQETETRAVMCYPLGLLLSVEHCGRRECCCRVLALLSLGQCPHVLAGCNCSGPNCRSCRCCCLWVWFTQAAVVLTFRSTRPRVRLHRRFLRTALMPGPAFRLSPASAMWGSLIPMDCSRYNESRSIVRSHSR